MVCVDSVDVSVCRRGERERGGARGGGGLRAWIGANNGGSRGLLLPLSSTSTCMGSCSRYLVQGKRGRQPWARGGGSHGVRSRQKGQAFTAATPARLEHNTSRKGGQEGKLPLRPSPLGKVHAVGVIDRVVAEDSHNGGGVSKKDDRDSRSSTRGPAQQ